MDNTSYWLLKYSSFPVHGLRHVVLETTNATNFPLNTSVWILNLFTTYKLRLRIFVNSTYEYTCYMHSKNFNNSVSI
jgi:hypothetical protein